MTLKTPKPALDLTQADWLLIHAALSISLDNAKSFYTALPDLQVRSDINGLETLIQKVSSLFLEPSRCAGVAPLPVLPAQAIANRTGGNLYDIFTCRTANILKANGITTVQALLGADLNKLLSSPSMYPSAISDIKFYFRQIEALA